VAHRVNGIPIVQAYAEGVAFGRVDLIVDRVAGRARESRLFAPRFVCAGAERQAIASAGPDACAPPSYEGRAVAFDASIASLLAPHRARAAAVRDRSLGVVVEAPFAQGARSESPLGNLVADLMRVVRPQADVAVYNWGGLRASVPSGPLTYGRLYQLIPFENAFASLEMTAADLGRAIVRSLERGYAHAVSGVHIEVRCDSGAPHPVVRRTSGEVIAPDTRLTIAVPDFLAAGGDGLFEGLPARASIETGPPIRDLLADALAARRGTISSSDLALFDAARPRLTFPGTLPLRCSGDSFTPAR
jgi:2',3'-cyclic-nucleotide 2'-phosphodiesterase (5'-nucleotidase family)